MSDETASWTGYAVMTNPPEVSTCYVHDVYPDESTAQDEADDRSFGYVHEVTVHE